MNLIKSFSAFFEKSKGMTAGLLAAGTALAALAGSGYGLPGRMQGDGSIISNGLKVTHGMNLNCDARKSQTLDIKWASNQFRMERLYTTFCSDNPTIEAGHHAAGFNTYTGSGVGRYNGVSNATIDVIFTDAGEPGKNDFASYTIRDADGKLVLTAAGTLDKGNHQAHP